MIDRTLRWDYKTFRRMGINTRTGKPVKSRRLKSWYHKDKEIEYMVHGMLLRPGDLIQTCRDYFNHRVQSATVVYREGHKIQDRTGSEWSHHELYATDVDITDVNDGFHSWRNCCGLPYTVEMIERHYRKESLTILSKKFEESYQFQWYGNNEEGFNNYLLSVSRAETYLQRLDKGLPICDEWGIEIPRDKF